LCSTCRKRHLFEYSPLETVRCLVSVARVTAVMRQLWTCVLIVW
jgi:hypothetical protein